jgi:hypothetical protein
MFVQWLMKVQSTDSLDRNKISFTIALSNFMLSNFIDLHQRNEATVSIHHHLSNQPIT